jgi:hypothetical protein
MLARDCGGCLFITIDNCIGRTSARKAPHLSLAWIRLLARYHQPPDNRVPTYTAKPSGHRIPAYTPSYWYDGGRYYFGNPGFFHGRYNGGSFGPCWTSTPIGLMWNCG